jgi:hypothetical protein
MHVLALTVAVLLVPLCLLPRQVSSMRLPLRLFSKEDTVPQAVARLCMCGRMLLRVARVLLAEGPGTAFSWVPNAWRVSFDSSLGQGFTRTIETEEPIVSNLLAASIGEMFRNVRPLCVFQ